MKYLIILSLFLIGCNSECVLSQIPPQVVYAGANCTGLIPDYKTKVTVAGCAFTLTQTPAPGFLLTATNKTANVTLKAIGTNGKSSQINFSVTLIDTVTPKIEIGRAHV